MRPSPKTEHNHMTAVLCKPTVSLQSKVSTNVLIHHSTAAVFVQSTEVR